MAKTTLQLVPHPSVSTKTTARPPSNSPAVWALELLEIEVKLEELARQHQSVVERAAEIRALVVQLSGGPPPAPKRCRGPKLATMPKSPTALQAKAAAV
jgi:hypothetical protein